MLHPTTDPPLPLDAQMDGMLRDAAAEGEVGMLGGAADVLDESSVSSEGGVGESGDEEGNGATREVMARSPKTAPIPPEVAPTPEMAPIPPDGRHKDVALEVDASSPEEVWPYTLNPQPSTLNPQPSTLNPQPSTLNSQPSTLNPRP